MSDSGDKGWALSNESPQHVHTASSVKQDKEVKEDDDESESDSDDENSKETQVEQDMKNLVQRIIARPEKGKPMRWEFTTPKGKDKFFGDNPGVIDKHVQAKGNILHLIVEDGKDRKHVVHALSAIVERYPNLLGQDLGNRHTPVYQAVQSNKPQMVSAMVNGFQAANSTLFEGITAKGQWIKGVLSKLVEGETCLHLAIKNNLRETAIRALVSIACEDLLSIQDKNGQTPLHLAVRYNDCGIPQRVETVKDMLRKSNDALTIQDKSGNSVFLHHLETKDEFEKDKAKQTKERIAARVIEDKPRGLEGRTNSEKPGSKLKELDEVTTLSPGNERDPKTLEKCAQRVAKAEPKKEELSGVKRVMANYKVDDVRPNQGALREEMSIPGTIWPQMNNMDEGDIEHGSRGSSPARRKSLSLKRPLESHSQVQRDVVWPMEIKHTALADARIPTMGFDREFRSLLPVPQRWSVEMEVIRRLMEVSTTRDAKALEEHFNQLMMGREGDAEGSRIVKELTSTEPGRMNDLPVTDAGTRKKSRKEKEKEIQAISMNTDTLEKCSAEIQLEIKLNCMRKRSPEESYRILYGNNPKDKQICFDFSSSGPAITMKVFKKSFQHVEFDTVLQYVAFPSVTVEKEKSNEQGISSKSPGKGRRDMIELFDWLRTDKKVARIVKVIVEDSQSPAHSDDAIIKSLSGFHVEVLHWLKVDLDPVTIREASSEIRELYLRWSGNNTVLRGWGEQEGLLKLKSLEAVDIELVAELNLESPKRTKSNFSEFKKRLHSGDVLTASAGKEAAGSSTRADVEGSKPRSIKVASSELHSTWNRRDKSRKSTGGPQSGYNNHQWLRNMDRFAQDMSSLWRYAAPRASIEARRPSLGEPVIVALIDDGVDLVDPSFVDRSYAGQSLDFGVIGEDEPRTSQRVHQYYHSEDGHGTVMANLIFRVCPMAKLYIIRMPTFRNSEGETRIVARSAALAIRAAINKRVNIISMSWTVAAKADNSKPDMLELQAAIHAAEQEKILMFCSSNDGGQFVSDTLPAHSNRDRVFCIGAANADGVPYSWAGPLERLDYILPGVDVVKQFPDLSSGLELKEKMAAMKSETGSSVATALASGLAAMILTLVKMAAIHEESHKESHKESTGATMEMVKKLQIHANMKAALDKLHPTQNKFLQVWKSLNTSTWRGYNDGGDPEKLGQVALTALTTFYG